MVSVFLLSTVIIGMLAFFEPCTIATHTLFAVRTHQNDLNGRLNALFKLLISRALLSMLLLILTVVIFDPPQWNLIKPVIILLIIAAVYIISRYSYIPIPHIDFSRLLPLKLKNQHAIQLGLTLPACTIPLFIIVAGMTITINSLTFALTTGLLYSAMFTLPTAIAIFTGISTKMRGLLNHAALITPFVTAGLFVIVALILVIIKLDLSMGSVKALLLEPSVVGIALGFIVGLVFSFNPVTFAAIPVIMAYVTKAPEKKRAMIMGGAFVLGMAFIQVILGVAAALGGEWVQTVMGRFWGVILGPILIVLGILWPGWIKIRIPWFSMKGKSVVGLWGAFILGIPFSIAVCPFCSPALLVMLTASAAIGSVSFGFFLLLAFALGRGVPIMIGAWSVSWLESIHSFAKYQKSFEVLAGITLILSGLYLLNDYFLIIIF
jgi:cytochrome c-type biogenesis protein